MTNSVNNTTAKRDQNQGFQLRQIIEQQADMNGKLETLRQQIASLADGTRPEFLGHDEAAKFLHVSKQSLYDLCYTGRIIPMKCGIKNVFPRQVLLDYLKPREMFPRGGHARSKVA